MWNWQHPEWPNFTWDAGLLDKAEQLFAKEQAIQVGIQRYMPPTESNDILIQLLSSEATDSSAIEGELLNRYSIQNSLQRQLGIKTQKITANNYEVAIAELMSSVYLTIEQPISQELLCRWHQLLTSHRRDIESKGTYRTHPEDIVIGSGPDFDRKIHFVAPPSKNVEKEMKSFIAWYNGSTQPPITKAALAHLWFESIHPFEDGNGRIGRAISEKALSGDVKNPQFIMLANTLLKRRKEYYAELGSASKQLTIQQWMLWFASVCIEAQRNTLSHIDFIIQKSRLMTKAEGQLNTRQEKVVLRLFKAGPEGFKGGLSADNYKKITGASTPTTTRDLRDLVEKNILFKEGERKATRYYLNVSFKAIESVSIEEII